MTVRELDAGKCWIAACAATVAFELNVHRVITQWANHEGYDGDGKHTLLVTLDAKDVSCRFNQETLEDCPADETVQTGIGKFLRNLFRQAIHTT